MKKILLSTSAVIAIFSTTYAIGGTLRESEIFSHPLFKKPAEIVEIETLAQPSSAPVKKGWISWMKDIIWGNNDQNEKTNLSAMKASTPQMEPQKAHGWGSVIYRSSFDAYTTISQVYSTISQVYWGDETPTEQEQNAPLYPPLTLEDVKGLDTVSLPEFMAQAILNRPAADVLEIIATKDKDVAEKYKGTQKKFAQALRKAAYYRGMEENFPMVSDLRLQTKENHRGEKQRKKIDESFYNPPTKQGKWKKPAR